MDAKEGVRELAAAHHHGRALRLKMAEKEPTFLRELGARREVLDAARHAERHLEEERDIERAYPFARIEQRSRLRALAHEARLNFGVHRHVLLRVLLAHVPRDDRHQRAVRAAPPLVVKVVLRHAAGGGGADGPRRVRRARTR